MIYFIHFQHLSARTEPAVAAKTTCHVLSSVGALDHVRINGIRMMMMRRRKMKMRRRVNMRRKKKNEPDITIYHFHFCIIFGIIEKYQAS